MPKNSNSDFVTRRVHFVSEGEIEKNWIIKIANIAAPITVHTLLGSISH